MSMEGENPQGHWSNDVIVPKSLLQTPGAFGGADHGDCLRGRMIVAGGRVQRLDRAPYTRDPHVVLPRLVEPHCHLDKCHTIHRLGPVGGDLTTALQAQRNDKVNWTETDLRNRASKGLIEAIAAGCGAVRTHVDWSDTADAPIAWEVFAELAQEHSQVRLQRAALTGIDQMAEDEFCKAVARTVAVSGGVLGCFVLHHLRIHEGLHNIFATADRHGLALDFHVDEGHGNYNGLEAIADAALAIGYEGPVLCGHAVSLIDRSDDDMARIADKLFRAGISVCALPTTNLYLQGRTKGTPDRRGITRLVELRAAGVPILIGSDNVGDAFCPLGAHDPMAALHLACLTGHLDPPLGRWLPSITTDAGRALGLAPNWIDGAALWDLLIAQAADLSEVVSGRSCLRPMTYPHTEHLA